MPQSIAPIVRPSGDTDPDCEMFTSLNPVTAPRQRRLLIGSLALHGILLAFLLHAPEPQLINPSSVALGQNGNSVTRLYFPSQSPDDSSRSSSDMQKSVTVTSVSAITS